LSFFPNKRMSVWRRPPPGIAKWESLLLAPFFPLNHQKGDSKHLHERRLRTTRVVWAELAARAAPAAPSGRPAQGPDHECSGVGSKAFRAASQGPEAAA